MSDFVLIYQGGSMPETEEAQKQAMDAWTSWFTSLGSAVKDASTTTGTDVLMRFDHWSTAAWNAALAAGLPSKPAS